MRIKGDDYREFSELEKGTSWWSSRQTSHWLTYHVKRWWGTTFESQEYVFQGQKGGRTSLSDEHRDDVDPFSLLAYRLSLILKMRWTAKKNKYPRSSKYSWGKKSNSSKSNVILLWMWFYRPHHLILF